jgi:hypothetical protein
MREHGRPGWAAWFLLLAAGCGPGMEERAPVQGQVFYRGRPLAGGTIVFTPDAERGGRGPLALGEIGADGRYTLRTEGRPGAVPGWHRITVAAGRGPDDSLPRRYRDPERSDLSRQVRAGQANVFDLHLGE